MHVGHSRKIQGPGYLPLRHRDFQRDETAVDMRCCVLGLEVTGQRRGDDDVGHWEYDPEKVGDLSGFDFWPKAKSPPDDDIPRTIGGWREVWPVVAVNTEKLGLKSPDATALNAAPSDYQPLRKHDSRDDVHFVVDKRYKLKLGSDLRLPSHLPHFGNNERWPKIVPGTMALLLSTTTEEKQKEIVLPADPRLFCVNDPTGDPTFGTLICNVSSSGSRAKPSFQIDNVTGAPLQSALKIIPRIRVEPAVQDALTPPIFWPGVSTIAVQMGNSGCQDVAGGILFDGDKIQRKTHARDSFVYEPAIGCTISRERGGFVHSGSEKDFHRIGVSGQGDIVNVGHLDLQCMWIWEGRIRDLATGNVEDGYFDGPLKFDGKGTQIGVQETEFEYEVQFLYDKLQDHRWLKQKLGSFGSDLGQFFWKALSPVGTDEFDPVKEHGVEPIDIKPDESRLHAHGQGGRAVIAGQDRVRKSKDPKEPDKPRGLRLVKERNSTAETRAFTCSSKEFCLPGLVFRPQHFHDESIDFRNRGSPKEKFRLMARETPLVARLEAYGQQVPASTAWKYRNKSFLGGHRYGARPTTDGGLCFLPPEVSLEQIRDGMISASDASVSRPTFLFPRFTRVGFGLPSTDRGGLQDDGLVLRWSESASQLRMDYVDANGALQGIGMFSRDGIGLLGFSSFAPTLGDGVGVAYLAEADTNPFTPPASGLILYVDISDGYLKYLHKTAGVIQLDGRIGLRKNSAGSTFRRRRVNLIEGANLTLTVADDAINEEVDVTIAASGGVGIAVLDFGAFPGASDASVAVTGQASIVASSVVEAWIRPQDSADHLADEHLVETIRIVAGNIVPGTGFTIYGLNTSEVNSELALGGRGRSATATAGAQPSSPIPWIGGEGTRIWGRWNVQWRWS